MNIYIYGNKKFVKEINSLLIKADINNIEQLQSLDLLKTTIKEYSDMIFIIDDEKIIKNKFLNKLNLFKDKSAITKEFLTKYGIEDVCFNSLDGLIKYILNKLNNNQNIQDSDEEIIQNDEIREIVNIEDIYDDEMEDAVCDLENKEKKKD